MVAEGDGVPAGWYPDPLGLPQLRWWDGSAWTEFTEAEHVEDADVPGEDDGSIIDLDADADADAGQDDTADLPTRPTAIIPEPLTIADGEETPRFASRRARREYERQRALGTGLPEQGVEPYARLETNPVIIPLTNPAPSGASTANAEASPDADPAEPTPSRQSSAPSPGSVPGATASAVPEAAAFGAAVSGREDLLAASALQPQATGDEPAAEEFSLEAIVVDEGPPPARTLLPKPTYTVSSHVLAMLPPLAAIGIVALVELPGVRVGLEATWGVLVGALLIGVLLAFLDRASLRRGGHERTASPLLALLTPMVYLSVRAVMTRRESGHGRAVVLAWIVGLVLTAVILYVFPGALSAVVPGFVPPWTSIIG